MDDSTEKRLDHIVEDDVRKGFRLWDLPEHLVAMLDEGHDLDPTIPRFTRVRFTKLTPKKRRLIGEAVQERYHADLQNKKLLSMATIRSLNIERGEWSDVMERRLDELSTLTAQLAAALNPSEAREQQLIETRTDLSTEFVLGLDGKNEDGSPMLDGVAKVQLVLIFNRWSSWTPARQAEYDRDYAESQGTETYNVDSDTVFLRQSVPSDRLLEVLDDLEDMREEYNSLVDYHEKRKELLELQVKQAKMYMNSAEQRRDQVEEFARLYYCTEAVDKNGKYSRITPTLDELWNLPEDVIGELLIEVFYFVNNVSPVLRETIESMGFLSAPRRTGATESSDESPAEPNSKADSAVSTETLATSSESAALTT